MQLALSTDGWDVAQQVCGFIAANLPREDPRQGTHRFNGELQAQGRPLIEQPVFRARLSAVEVPLKSAPNSFWRRAMSICGGSNEIQRNLIARQVPGL